MASTKSILVSRRDATVALLVLLICGCSVLTTPADDAYKRGKALLEKKDLKGAILALDQAIKLDPKFAAAYSNRGFAYYVLCQNQKALDDFNKAIELNPKDAESYERRGDLNSGLKLRQKAIDDYSKAIELNPNFMEAYVSRSAAYWQLGNYVLGSKDIKRARELGYAGSGSFE